MTTATHLTLLEVLEVVGPFSEAEARVSALVTRLEREGVRGLCAMQFYADRAANELSAVITFSDPRDMPAHLAMISSWPEFASFAQSIRIKDMRIHGQLSADVEAWIRKFQGPLRQFPTHIGSFVRA